MSESAIPLSYYMSNEAKRCLTNLIEHGMPWMKDIEDIQAYRQTWDAQFYGPRLEKANRLFKTQQSVEVINGVNVLVVEPDTDAQSDVESNDDRVLINLHGGAFIIGEGMGGLIESIPITAMSGIKTLSICYRQGPEYLHPAGVDDVIAVYNVLLNRYHAKRIGIFGCSAGGLLTAMVVSRMVADGVPLPGAVGIFCAPADARFEGDSRYFVPPLVGEPAPEPHQLDIGHMEDYLAGHDLADPLISPVETLSRLAAFPPTLLVSGGRAGELSSVLNTHAKMHCVGVDARLHVWEGMWHGFFYDVDLPESQQFFTVASQFLHRHLGYPGDL